MNCDTMRINWEWLMMLIVHLFVILVYQSQYIFACYSLLKKRLFQVKKRHFRFSVPEKAIAMI